MSEYTTEFAMNFYETEVSNKVIPKLILSKNVNIKKCAPNFKFFNEKKPRKIWMIFDIEN